MMNEKDLRLKSNGIRRGILRMAICSGMGHIGGALSSADLLTALFYRVMRVDPQNPEWAGRDRFILSKGHCVEGYLCILADLGFFPPEELEGFCTYASPLIGHPNNKVPGVEMNTGALGHGLSLAAGMALGAKRDHADTRVYTLMGDGEQDEGTIWEAAMFAAHHRLDNLCAILDRNRLQISGPTEEIMALGNLAEKWRSFGFYVLEIDGNNMLEILEGFGRLETVSGQPKLLLAHTVKGKGVSFMENRYEWHHGAPSEEEYEIALRDLELVEKELRRS